MTHLLAQLILLILLAWPTLAAAETFAALYDVTGVASADVLNVRAGPRAGFDKIGSLAGDGMRVEVISV